MLPRNLFIGFPAIILLLIGVYYLPPVNEQLAWRIAAVRADIVYTLNPPEEALFLPEEQPKDDAVAQATKPGVPVSGVSPESTEIPVETATPTPIPTALPPVAKLDGVVHEFQKWNNCGPATLSMALSYWGWEGTQQDTVAYLKPDPGDVNVMPYELKGYVEEETELTAIVRVGGELNLLKKMIANGYPVIVEKGTEYKDGWVGHYVLVTGYDDREEMFVTQDSLVGFDFMLPYELLQKNWQAFNYTFMIVYPKDNEAEVTALLGLWSDEGWAVEHAMEIARQQIRIDEGRELYYDWFNLGSNHLQRGDYEEAAFAYDFAFELYSNLRVDERPWRMMWYQTGPYEAYFQAGRYNDVINLANTTLWAAARSVMEESYYWRGMAKEAMGDIDGALTDFRKSVEMNPNFRLGSEALARLDEIN